MGKSTLKTFPRSTNGDQNNYHDEVNFRIHYILPQTYIFSPFPPHKQRKPLACHRNPVLRVTRFFFVYFFSSFGTFFFCSIVVYLVSFDEIATHLCFIHFSSKINRSL